MNLEAEILRGLAAARAAAHRLALASTEQKNRALSLLARDLRDSTAAILAANQKDLEAARSAGQGGAFVERLTLTPERVAAMARGVEEVIALPDPVGETIARWSRPNGLDIAQIRVPLGVIAIVYESRPNVTIDAARTVPEGRRRGGITRRTRGARDQRGAGGAHQRCARGRWTRSGVRDVRR